MQNGVTNHLDKAVIFLMLALLRKSRFTNA